MLDLKFATSIFLHSWHGEITSAISIYSNMYKCRGGGPLGNLHHLPLCSYQYDLWLIGLSHCFRVCKISLAIPYCWISRLFSLTLTFNISQKLILSHWNVIFSYRTRVRSLAIFVTDSLTDRWLSWPQTLQMWLFFCADAQLKGGGLQD